MNRSAAAVGALLVVAGGVLIGLQVAGGGRAAATFLLPGAMAVPVGLILTLYGATRPDARSTTVRGVFGNEEENELERRLRTQRHVRFDPRYLPSPHESVNCGGCYTVIPADRLRCPRCDALRRCQGCARPLYFLAGAIRCAPCLHGEATCVCAPVPRSKPAPGRRPYAQ